MRGNARFGLNYESELRKENKPILSEDQLEEIQKLILESYINKVRLEFTTYKAGQMSRTMGVINLLYYPQSKLVLDNKRVIYFCEIIKVRKVDF